MRNLKYFIWGVEIINFPIMTLITHGWDKVNDFVLKASVLSVNNVNE